MNMNGDLPAMPTTLRVKTPIPDMEDIGAFMMEKVDSPGLTKREMFAAMAMQGALSARADMNVRGYEGWIEEFSREAIRFADALLAELEKSP